MKITKFEHACLVVEEQGSSLVIDPGVYSKSFTPFTGIVAVIVTHVHPDHFSPDTLKAILQINPEARIFTTQEVADEFTGSNVTPVKAGDTETAGPFKLQFYGGQHATIHASYPAAQNIGVMVNDVLYYPGDSFVRPKTADVPILAVPANAPWMRVGEAMDFLASVRPGIAFPTHNVFINEDGQALADRLLGGIAKDNGIDYRFIRPGESLEA